MLIYSDCLDIMSKWEDGCIDAIVTDPPYGLFFMGSKWDYDIPKQELWREMLRVAKPGSWLLAFGGTRTFHRLACRIEDSGWEICDCIMWVYGNGMPKSRNLLKPSWEPIIMARKHGKSSLNIDDCRIPVDLSIDDPRLGGKGSWKTDKAAKNVYAGGFEGKRISSSEKGRWPSNLVHDGSNEVMDLFPYTKSGKPGIMKKCINVGAAYGKESRKPGTPMTGIGDEGNAARFFYCAKSSRSERTCNGQVENRHPTVKPLALMRYLCKLVVPTGGIMFDPFMGSGSTCIAAMQEEIKYIGIDNDEMAYKTAQARMETMKQTDLFD